MKPVLKMLAVACMVFLPSSVRADVECSAYDNPNLSRDYTLIAKGELTKIIEPVYEMDCQEMSKFSQCIGALEKKEARRDVRMIFSMDKIYYTDDFMLGPHEREQFATAPDELIVYGDKELLGTSGIVKVGRRMAGMTSRPLHGESYAVHERDVYIDPCTNYGLEKDTDQYRTFLKQVEEFN